MKIKGKGLVSLVLACTFTVVVISGLALYVSPKGRVAHWTGWTLGGLDKHGWEALHINACFLMLAIVAFHVFYNWRVFWSYIRRKSAGLNLKLEMAIALLVTGLLVAGTIAELPPLTYTVALSDRIKYYWERTSATAPTPHAEELPLGRFARSLGIEPADLLEALQQEGLEVEQASMTVGELAEQNGMVPAQIYTAITKHFPGAMRAAGGRGRGGGRGGAGGRASAPADKADDFQPGPGSGMGQGRGRGMGMGMGRGQGRGGGMGQGWGRGAGQGQGRDVGEPGDAPNGERDPNGTKRGENAEMPPDSPQ